MCDESRGSYIARIPTSSLVCVYNQLAAEAKWRHMILSKILVLIISVSWRLTSHSLNFFKTRLMLLISMKFDSADRGTKTFNGHSLSEMDVEP